MEEWKEILRKLASKLPDDRPLDPPDDDDDDDDDDPDDGGLGAPLPPPMGNQ